MSVVVRSRTSITWFWPNDMVSHYCFTSWAGNVTADQSYPPHTINYINWHWQVVVAYCCPANFTLMSDLYNNGIPRFFIRTPYMHSGISNKSSPHAPFRQDISTISATQCICVSGRIVIILGSKRIRWLWRRSMRGNKRRWWRPSNIIHRPRKLVIRIFIIFRLSITGIIIKQ